MKDFVEKLLKIIKDHGGEIHIKAMEIRDGSPILSAAWKSDAGPFKEIYGDYVLMDNGSAEDVVEAVRGISAAICQSRS